VLFAASVAPVKGPVTNLPVDKAEHFLAYGITAALFFRHFAVKYGERAFWISAAAASVYGACLEIVQAFVPYRQFSLADMLANAAGAFVFSTAAHFWRKR
jgi:VanZ family protein